MTAHYVKLLCLLCLGFTYSVVHAGELLSVDEIHELYSGRVVEKQSKSGWPMRIESFADGRIEGRMQTGKGNKDSGKWWVPANGKYCEQWNTWRGGKEKCWQLEREGGVVFVTGPKGNRREFKK